MSDMNAGVTKEEIRWCFRNMLSREIEDEATINHLLKTEENFGSLVRTITSSHEFRQNQILAKRPAVDRDGFNYDESRDVQDRTLKVLRMIEPKTVEGFGKVRVGGQTDGGYVMINDFDGIKGAYSLGIKDDVTWDREVASHGIDIYQYDHTIDALPEENPRFHWFKTGIAGTKHDDLDTLPNLMKANGHEQTSDLLLKCDIEGHEWEMLSRMSPGQLGQFRQIVLETHGWCHMDRDDFARGIEESVANLSAGHSLVHVHANNCASYSIVGGIPVPAVLEMTFVRSDIYRLTESKELFPTSLDAPCDLNRADFFLGNFRF